ncbi:hypothetical protein [Yinghuangia sp. YIM S09857]
MITLPVGRARSEVLQLTVQGGLLPHLTKHVLDVDPVELRVAATHSP